MSFQSPLLQLADLLAQVRKGEIQLPDFQREYKWDDDRIKSLLATLTLGHPMGVLMMLETGGRETRFKPRPLTGALPGAGPEFLLLDGQQRMTSLFQALGSGRAVETVDPRGKNIRRWYYLDLEAAIDPAADREEAVVSVPEDRVSRSDFARQIDLDISTRALEVEHGMFPLRLVYDQSDAMQWLFEYAGSRPERMGKAQLFQSTVLGPMLSYQIPAIQLGKDTTKEAVCTVFEKVNTGGLPLNVFELLTATFAGDPGYFEEHGTDFRLNEFWQQASKRLHRHPVLKGLESTDYLQAVCLLATRERRRAALEVGAAGVPRISARRADILKLELAEFLRWAPAAEEGFVWAAAFLARESVFRDEDLPYRTQLVPLAALRVLMGREIDTHAVAPRIRQWYWCGVLGEQYGSSVETKFARDVELVPRWARREDGAKVPDTVDRAGFRESRLLSLRTRRSAAYKGIHALVMRNGAKDWKYDEAIHTSNFERLKVDIHHVFPYAWCEKRKVDPNRRDSIVNKTPLSYDTNRSIGGKAPSAYLRQLERSVKIAPGDLDAVVASHLIDTVALRGDDFEAFFAARMAALVAIIQAAMGVPVMRDVTGTAAAEVEATDLPDNFEPEDDDTTDEDVESEPAEPREPPAGGALDETQE